MKVTITNTGKNFIGKACRTSFPYSYNVVNFLKSLLIRRWIPETKEWEFPYTEMRKFVEFYKGIRPSEAITVEDLTVERERHVEIPSSYRYKAEPFPHQIEGIRFGLNHDNFLLSDEQGVGKTYQTINIAVIRKMLYGYKHCLIICAVNGSKYNWKKECEKYSDEKAHILGTRKNSRGEERVKGNTEKLEDLKNIDSLPYFIITNKESLRDEEIKNKLKAVAEMCIVDEIHLAKNHRSQEGKGILSIKAKSKIAISGTPILNNPIDTYFTMRFLGYETHSMTVFRGHYCVMGGYGGHEVVGYRNLKELQDRFGRIQIRRLKKDCLSLPDKIETTEYVELSGRQSVLYKDVLNATRSDIDKISLSPNPLTQLIRLRQATGNPNLLSSSATESVKYDRACEIVEELAQNGRKCLVFSNWVEMLKPLYERLKKHNPALIIGDTKDIEAEKDKLNNNPSCHVCLGTIGAMGTSHTLTGADTVIFLDEPWNRGTKEQAIDRCHRIGTRSNVTVITLIAKDTIDERIHDLVLQKGAYADLIVDGRITYNKKQMLSYLLNGEQNQ